MDIKSARSIEELSEVLKNPNAKGPKTVYWVFNNVSQNSNSNWKNMTVITPGNYDGEFPKTYGHYHNVDVNETYELIHGQGIFLLQKRRFADDDYIDDEIESVVFVEMKIGEKITLTPEWGHSWINIGNEPLITLDDWNSGHTDQDYKPIRELKGTAYYLIKKDGRADFVKNSNYKTVPKPMWLTVDDFMNNGI